VHLSDISWNETGEAAIRNFKKGDEVEAVILAIDPERERISLGIKQLENDPYSRYLEEHPKGTLVTGVVSNVDNKRAIIDLESGIQGQLRAAEISNEQIKDVQEHIKMDETITAKLLGFDRKQGIFNLSLKALTEDSGSTSSSSGSGKESRGGASGGKETITNTTLGDLLREQVENNNKEEGE
jgi:small subunit ribosomal protein S1